MKEELAERGERGIPEGTRNLGAEELERADSTHRGKSFEKIVVPEEERLPFRFDRHSIEEFRELAVECQLETVQGDPPVGIQVKDLSSSGLSFQVHDSSAWQQGQTIARLRLGFDDWIAYDGPAVVSSIRQIDRGAVLGIQLTDYLLNIEELIRMRDVKRAYTIHQDRIQEFVGRTEVSGCHEYRSRIADFLLFLRAAREEMNALEQEVGWEEIHGRNPNAARDCLFRHLEDGFVRQCDDWIIALNEIYLSDPATRVAPVEHFSRALLHSYLLEAPVLERAFRKPLGYPGDYMVMIYIYDNDFEGATLFGKAVHKAAVMTAASKAVRARKDLLKSIMHEKFQALRGRKMPLRILSVAAGPARELKEFLEELSPEDPVEIVLFEQDKQALAHSNRDLRSLIARRKMSGVRLFSLRDTITNLLGESDFLRPTAPYDLILASGLYDYLKAHNASRLSRKLFDLLREGGELLIGNFSHCNTTRWIMENQLAWYLHHRTEQEILDFAELCAPHGQFAVISEPNGVNLFLRGCRV
ncbi:MAG TPA: class I SAM-dependent methyltransferase family protein [Myxococcota bacterium]|nr:class I SAM-dependent methyltransferase family protein [Myxococcota bacterium]HQK51033.1 class I SAM-dependent methyltransferase family protein [Myxococcota bacterium]